MHSYATVLLAAIHTMHECLLKLSIRGSLLEPVPYSARRVLGAVCRAMSESVGPIRARNAPIASGLARIKARIGPEDMKDCNFEKKGFPTCSE